MSLTTLNEKLRGQISPITLYHCADCNEYFNADGEFVRLEHYEDYERLDLLTIEEKQCQDCKEFYMNENQNN
jgi:hypothetical protein